MQNKKIYLGGEFYYSPFELLKKCSSDFSQILHEKFPGRSISFTGGGLSSISLILDALYIKTGQKVLLPSYLCHSILIPFKMKGIAYSFFKVNGKMEIDTNDLLSKADPSVAAIFFINYFGFKSNLYKETDTVRQLHERGISIIEDTVQSTFSDFAPLGDFVFDSFRKFLPIDGSVIISAKPIDTDHLKINRSYQFSKTTGQWLKWIIRSSCLPSDGLYLWFFDKSKIDYNKTVPCRITGINKRLLNLMDPESIKSQRQKNYIFLLNELKDHTIFKYLPDGVTPLGFPMLTEKRDEIVTSLRNNHVFCPVHWKLTGEIDKEEFPESWNISDKILTIPIGEKVKDVELKYFITLWKKIKESI